MSASSTDPHPLELALRRLRRSGLLAVAACAIGIGLIALRAGGEAGGDVDRRITWTALALAAASILTRRSLRNPDNPRAIVARQAISVLCAVGLGLLGAWLALRAGQWRVGLLYNVAAALLLLRPVRVALLPRARGT